MAIIKISEYFPLVLLDSKFKKIWEIILFISLMINLWYAPVRISFRLLDNDLIHTIGNFFPFIIFNINILINLNSITFINGKILEKKKDIINSYLKNYFKFDIITFLAFYFSYFKGLRGFELFYLLRFNKIKKLACKFKEEFVISDKNECILELISLLAFILYSAHFFGCFWNFIGEIAYHYKLEESWLETVD